jgi:hypothetical protein
MRSNHVTYKGEKKAGAHACVFASVVAGVNSVAGKAVWTQDTLFDKWQKEGITDVNFANIDSVAIQPVKSDVKEQTFGNGYIAQGLGSGQLPLRGVRVLVCAR